MGCTVFKIYFIRKAVFKKILFTKMFFGMFFQFW